MTVVDRGLALEDISLENDDFADGVPHETFALLRREAPVWWYDWPLGRGYWCVTKHADVVAVSRDTKTFTSEQGANLEDLDEEQRVVRQSMLETDPPRHTRLRGLVGPSFTPRAIKAYELALRELTAAVLDKALPLGEFDFIEEVAKQLPIRVLARLLGAPDEDTDRLIDWGDRMIGNTDPELADVLSDSSESEQYRMLPFRSPASLELFEYAHQIATERRRAPEEDLVSKLVQS
jgi:cytochrome P450